MKKLIPLFLLSIFVTSVSSEEIDVKDSAINELSNEALKVIISNSGKLVSIENFLSLEKYSFLSDQFELNTDIGILSNKNKKPKFVKKNNDSIVYQFDYGDVYLELAYILKSENSFFRRVLKVVTKNPLRINNLKLGKIKFSKPADEAIHYMTFWMAPTVEFIRFKQGGMFTGIENPFYHADLDEKGVALNFEPGLILKHGEAYTSEAQFIGVYKKSGRLIEDSARPFRYVNGSGHIPIDLNESRAMRTFALDYLSPVQNKFLNINYQFFHPLPQMPNNENDKLFFLKTIDTFSDIEGDMIIFKPLHPYEKPDSETEYWNVLPEDKTSTASQIVDYAEKKGISYGFYMGVAAHGKEGNSAGLPFRSEKTSWKKMDAEGRRGADNCIGDKIFFEWWFRVQDNTIKKYKLSNWSWDPSMGSAMNCYDENHGHIAGKGAYIGWRRCIELKGKLKNANPGLFIQGFYGDKHFGLWGLKHTDQHEVYNEQTAIVSTIHPQISDDRQNADGLRFQNYWSMRFRFLPTVIGHSLVHRMNEGGFDRELIKAWDYYGWQYSLMSALAVSGSVMPAILPYESDLVPNYKEFYKKWTTWAKNTFQYVNYTEPFGDQVQPGSIDGYARIKGKHGFIFLFNGNPRPSNITFEVGDEINLKEKGSYELVELYPSEEEKIVLDNQGKSVFSFEDKANLTLPANSCSLIELRPSTDLHTPVLLGINGELQFFNNQLLLNGVKGKPGYIYPIRVRLPNPNSVKTVKVNNVDQTFSRNENEILFDIQFSGDRFVRELDHWSKIDGLAFNFPYHDKKESLNIKTKFVVNEEIVELLQKARTKNFNEMNKKIGDWQDSQEFAYSYHNFTGSRPDRLWLIIPFTFRCLGQAHFNQAIHQEHQKVTNLKVIVNSKNVGNLLKNDNNDHSYYMDITDLIVYGGENTIEISMEQLGKNEFMGPFLMYPNEELVNEVLPKPRNIIKRVTYTKSLIPVGPPRYLKGSSGPVITEATVIGNVSRQKSTKLHVNVNLSRENIRSVSYSHSGFPWMGKVALTYDEELKRWIADVKPGDRWRIQESENIYVWAVGIDGLYSEFYPVKVGWDFE